MNKSQLLQSLKERGFSKQILEAFAKVERENFIPGELRDFTYEDTALPIGKGQTISQPYTIATMFSLLGLKKSQKVLEVGSGCGYVLALLSELVGEKGKIFGIEIIKELVEKSRQNLKEYKNISVYNKNGAGGLPKHAPFDRILISAGCREVPKKLLFQLKTNGILVAPVGSRYDQSLVAYKKIKGKIVVKEKLPNFVFVPFIEK